MINYILRMTMDVIIGPCFMIDAVGYVSSESVRCDDCFPWTLGYELILSLAGTLNQN